MTRDEQDMWIGLLARLEKEPGKRTDRTSGNGAAGSAYREALTAADLEATRARRWQRLASFDAERRDELLAECRETQEENHDRLSAPGLASRGKDDEGAGRGGLDEAAG